MGIQNQELFALTDNLERLKTQIHASTLMTVLADDAQQEMALRLHRETLEQSQEVSKKIQSLQVLQRYEPTYPMRETS
jgi:hypothetical protein